VTVKEKMGSEMKKDRQKQLLDVGRVEERLF